MSLWLRKARARSSQSTSPSLESRMRRKSHVRFGGRGGLQGPSLPLRLSRSVMSAWRQAKPIRQSIWTTSQDTRHNSRQGTRLPSALRQERVSWKRLHSPRCWDAIWSLIQTSATGSPPFEGHAFSWRMCSTRSPLAWRGRPSLKNGAAVSPRRPSRKPCVWPGKPC
jgi:hypothetical protein